MASSCQPSSDNVFGPAITGCRSDFDFTLLFEQTILSIAPSALLLILAPSRLIRLLRSSVKTLPSHLRSTKAAVALCLVALELALLIEWTEHSATRASVPSAVLSFLDAIIIFALSTLEHTRAVRPSFLLNIYLFVSLIFDVTQARTLFLRGEDYAILGLCIACIGIKVFLLLLEAKDKRPYLKTPYAQYPPEATSGIFNRSFFWWINPLFIGGFRKILSLDDLYMIDQDLRSELLLERMQKSWHHYRSSGRYALVYASISCLRWPLARILFPRLCLIGFNYAQPFLISRAISYVGQKTGAQTTNDGYGLIAATGLVYIGIAICTVHYQHYLNRMITMFRGAMASLIYSRTLQLRAGIYDESSALTLMSTDVDRIIMSLQAANELWARIVEIAIGVWLLERQLGWICVAPILVVSICVLGSLRVARFMGARQKLWVESVQRRVAITSSMLGSMKSVKMMGLSDTMSSTIQGQRIRELDLSKKLRILSVWRESISITPSLVGPLLTFIIFAILATTQGSNRLSTVQAFTSLAIISLLTTPAAELLSSLPRVPMAVGCFDRIQTFLLSQSWEDQRIRGSSSLPTAMESEVVDEIELQHFSSASLGNDAVVVDNASIRPSSESPLALRDISLRVGNSSLTMVIGVVGSGKSTLLKAILGELTCDNGYVRVSSKRMAYCSQSTWLQNATVRQIVCGVPEDIEVDQEWYLAVMHACALNEDVAKMLEGHETLIGSRGLTLSGGQKQRLALARAVYARQDIVVLDDVLSALDATTEGLVVDRLLGKTGIFRRLGSTVVLATHAVRHLPLADHIVVLNTDGQIAEQGTFEYLKAQNDIVRNILLGRSSKSHGDDGDQAFQEKRPSPAVIKAIKGATAIDLTDLTRRTGDASVYRYYLASIGWKLTLVVMALVSGYTIASKFPLIWLNLYAQGTIQGIGLFTSVYAVFTFGALASIAGSIYVMFLFVIPKSGASLHKALLHTVMRAPQSFFAKTDTGVTLNRFSQDMTLVDSVLPSSAIISLQAFANCVAEAGLIATGSSYMALTIPGLVLALYLLQKVYLRTSRQIRFLDLEAKSPLYSHFLETLEGLSTIRAFGWQERSIATHIKRLDSSQRPYYLLLCIQRWLNLVLGLLVTAIAVTVVALAFTLRNSSDSGLLGIALNGVLGFNQSLEMLMMFWTLLETSIGAIARVKTFVANTESEDKAGENFEPGLEWPSRGAIEFRNVSASYGHAAPALRNISMNINLGEKIGICGRTGSGKSSLLSVLLRLLDMNSGTIFVDGVDLQIVPREIIRTRVVAIPQDPFILTGSIRLNADPIGIISDEEIIAALMKIRLWDTLFLRGGLDAEITTQPLSYGQQQLFCLARAMLRRGSKILVLDEATSNVDSETDQLMQSLIREEFKDHTILTVAHRLDSIRGSDKVAVLEEGRLVEFGDPRELLNRPSAFRELQRG